MCEIGYEVNFNNINFFRIIESNLGLKTSLLGRMFQAIFQNIIFNLLF